MEKECNKTPEVTATEPQSIQNAVKDTHKQWKTLLLKFFILFSIVAAIVVFIDHKKYFQYYQFSGHKLLERRWNSYYRFTKKHKFDVIVIGNSHVLNGINPDHLSCALGANCMMMGANGLPIKDLYFYLQEMLEQSEPKVVVLETYCFGNIKSTMTEKELKQRAISQSLQNFSMRKSVIQKLISTPYLFPVDNYLEAWSPSIRNHNFLLRNPELILNNIQRSRNAKPEDNELYLGRYVRFTQGMSDSVLNLYKAQGSPYKCNDRVYKEDDYEYIQKTKALCQKHHVKLVFLTIPMYYKCIDDYTTYKNNLIKVLKPGDIPWLDLQELYDTALYTPKCFENIYAQNQHMTYTGSLVSSYKLAEFLQSLNLNLPNRSQDKKWRELFYNHDGFIYNQTPSSKDTMITMLSQKAKNYGGIVVDECFTKKVRNGTLLCIKVNKEAGLQHLPSKLFATLRIRYRGKDINTSIEISRDKLICPIKHFIYTKTLNQRGEVIELVNVRTQ